MAIALRRDAEVIRFCWSGRNRMRDRIEAAKSLRELLYRAIRSRPDLDISVIAHSHGGNVALQALNGSDASHREAAVLHRVRLVTLATPFLSARVKLLPEYIRSAGLVAVVLSLLVITGIAAVAGAVFAQSVIHGPGVAVSDLKQFASFEFVVVVVPAALSSIYTWSLLSYTRRAGAPVPWRMADPLALSAEIRFLQSPRGLSDGRLLVIRTHGDEASGVMGASGLTTSIARGFLDGRLAVRFLLALALIIVLLTTIEQKMGVSGGLIQSATTLTSFGFAIFGAAFIIALLLLALNFSAGWDSVALGPFVEIDVTPTPTDSTEAKTITNVQVKRGFSLRHGVHSQPDAIRAVQSFLIEPVDVAISEHLCAKRLAPGDGDSNARRNLLQVTRGRGQARFAELVALRTSVRMGSWEIDPDAALRDLSFAIGLEPERSDLRALRLQVGFISSCDSPSHFLDVREVMKGNQDLRAIALKAEVIRAARASDGAAMGEALRRARVQGLADPMFCVLEAAQHGPESLIEALDAQIEANPGSLELRRERLQAWFLYVPDSTEQLRLDADVVVERLPNDPIGFACRGMVSVCSPDDNHLMGLLDSTHALTLDPLFGPGHFVRGASIMRLRGSRNEALQNFRVALKLGDHNLSENELISLFKQDASGFSLRFFSRFWGVLRHYFWH